MPAIGQRLLNQKAVLWAFSSTDVTGDPQVSAAIEISVRWVKKRQESIDPDASPIAIESEIMVDRDIAVGSILRLGPLKTLPSPPDNLEQVIEIEEVPNVKARATVRMVRTIKFKSTLPTIV